jgi:methionine sulfoxide reductase catalytic subunit
LRQEGFPPPDEVTPAAAYFGRRRLLQGGALAVSAVATGALYRGLNGVGHEVASTKAIESVVTPEGGASLGYRVEGEALTSLASITNYNNFYEFSTDKEAVARSSAHFDTRNWKVDVGGLVHAGRTFDLDDLRKVAPVEERVYRMRCVEAWSMVIPWAGYSLARLLDVVQPASDARYVAFQTLLDRSRMPGQNSGTLDWPYVEGLRLDEAMHPLALLATGLYGRELPPQDGAPVRLVVPWKYGFKGIKSIVKITLTAEQPPTTWNLQAPDEYGFFANVNPAVDHPRWSQATEQRIGENGRRRRTLLFNGYAEQVAGLYAGMNLREHY